MRPILRATIVILAGVSWAAGAWAAVPGQPADWPCVQRLVPDVTAGEFWSGPPPPAGVNWHDDARIAALVAAVAPRAVPMAEADAKLAAFADAVPKQQRAKVLPELFGALVDAENEQRQSVIDDLEDLYNRQKSIAALVNKVTDEENGVPLPPTTVEAARHDEVYQRRGFLIRMFRDTQQTIRYACQVPGELEGRLGSFARTLQAKL